MAARICSNCGYEGRGKGSGGGGGLFRLIGMVTLMPFFSLWKLATGRGGKQCPHCNLPTMVRLKSDEGQLVRYRMDVELGLIQPRKPVEKKTVEAFGNGVAAAKVETKKPVNPEEW